MSLIKKADVKNHLSARHRTEIHLARPGSQSDATGFLHEESTGNENPLSIPAPSEPETAPIGNSKSAKA